MTSGFCFVSPVVSLTLFLVEVLCLVFLVVISLHLSLCVS